MKLVRKVNPAKWKGSDWASLDKIPSDALTLCMKTQGNTLSFWQVEEGKEEEAILALLGTQDRIDKIDIAFIDSDILTGVSFVQTKGNTFFADLSDLHINISELDHSSFMHTANALGTQIYSDNTKRLTKADFRTRMQTAVNNQRIMWSLIPPSMQKDLQKPLEQ